MTALVSAIIPTMAGRNRFLLQAVRCFLRQAHSEKELIIVSDDPDFDPDSLPKDDRIRRIWLSRQTSIGEKLNIGITEAKGDFLMKQDDDDWYHPDFMGASLSAMTVETPERTITRALRYLVFYPKDWKLVLSSHFDAHIGSGMMFHRALWKDKPFRDESISEDTYFRNDHHPYRDTVVHGDELLIIVRHGENHWVQHHTGLTVDALFSQHRPVYDKPIEDIIFPEDLELYKGLKDAP